VARRMSRQLVALSTAAVATVFSVGYVHTQPAAARLAAADSISTASSSLPAAPRTIASTVQTTTSEAATTSARFTLWPAETGATLPQGSAGRFADGGRRSGRGGEAPSQFLPAPTITPSPVVTGSSAATVTARSSQYRDGTYTGMGENRHGDVQVQVTIAGGRIASAAIAQCGMQYPCSRISMLPGEVLARQNTNVDLVSGATMSSTAYQEAVLQALAKAAG
jgi:uncharacterized protein with FMN-binding domain